MEQNKSDTIAALRKQVLQLEGYRLQHKSGQLHDGIAAIAAAFPGGIFPSGVIHEFLCTGAGQLASSGGFISGLLQHALHANGTCFWISKRRSVFPPALRSYGIDPHKIIFIDAHKDKDILWATEEALKCKGIAAVVAEIGELSMTHSRRLQLAVEASKVTGYVLRTDPNRFNVTACSARWAITTVPSITEKGLPGVGFPRWQVTLLKVRNGRPGSWLVEWRAGQFKLINSHTIPISLHDQNRKAG